MRSSYLYLSPFKLTFLVTLGVLWLYFMNFQVFSLLDKKWGDFLGKLGPAVSHHQNILIAAVDAKSIDHYGRWPWPRFRMAELIETLSQHYQVRTIGVDIVFSEPEEASSNDAQLADSIARAGNVVAGYYLFSKSGFYQFNQRALLTLKAQVPSKSIDHLLPLLHHRALKWESFRHLLLKQLTQQEYDLYWEAIFKATHLHRWHDLSTEQVQAQIQSIASSVPDIILGQRFQKTAPIPESWSAEVNIDPIAQVVKSQGHFSAFLDKEDGVLRRVQPLMRLQDQFYTSLDLQILKHYLGNPKIKVKFDQHGVNTIQIGEKRIRVNHDGSLLLKFKGGRETFATHSVYDLIEHKVPKEDLQDRIALVGITEMGILDTYVTPTELLYPGTEVHATALDNLLSETYLRIPANLRFYTFILLFCLGIGLSFVVSNFSYLTTTIISLGCLFLAVGIQYYLLHAAFIWTGIFYILLLIFSIWLAQNLYALFHAEKEKRATQQLSHQIIHNAPVSIFTTDKTGVVIQENSAAREIFGYQKSQTAIGENIARPTSSLHQSIGEPDLLVKILHGEEGMRQFSGVPYQSQVSEISLVVNIHIAPLKKGEIIQGAIVQFEDISDAEEARKEREYAQQEILKQKQIALDNLQKSDKLKDQFLANTSHELRTPLNGIIGLSDSLLDGAGGTLTPIQASNLQMIVQSGRRLLLLINDILDASKMKQQDLQLHISPVDVLHIAESVLSLSQPLVGEKSLSLICEIPENCRWVQADENRLQQILLNLVGNGIKFSQQGKVIIKAAQNSEKIMIAVTDTGIGIAAEHLQQIFHAFEQLDGSAEREYGGTGLGLSITRELIELHGSTIEVESHEGVGSTFSFHLPVAEKQSHEQIFEKEKRRTIVHTLEKKMQQLKEESFSFDPQFLTTASEEKPWVAVARPLVVLIVDDEPINSRVVENYLQLQHYETLTAETGFQALDILEKTKPDLVLLDLMMPGLSGYQVCLKIRESHSAAELPIILLTAKNQIDDLVYGFQCGANDYLTKPFHKDELIARVTTHTHLAKINRSIGRFVPASFLHFLQRDSIVDVQLGDHVEKEMTVLFSDIRSFTMLSEKMTPAETFQFVISYLSRMGPLVRKYQGFIDKYIGDAIMALFDNEADDAVQAAIDMIGLLTDYNEGRQRAGYDVIEIGIGINTGNLMLGTIGEVDRLEGTVLSDSVNLASRIEGMNKVYGTKLLISQYTLQQLKNPKDYTIRFIDHVQVKGKTEPVSIYEVYNADPPELQDLKAACAPLFEKAWNAYQEEKFKEAKALFQQCYQKNPNDRVLQVYLARCQRMLSIGRDDILDAVSYVMSLGKK
ncbi:MAG: CHASE2 domain-containing protein [SAR324 cluster bacterium]|nr:CHASE2 domain-containing protein [SAR324 cluster bacterium]